MEHNKSINLIEKIISNSASEKEIEQFNTWLEKSGDNRSLFRKAKTLWEKLDTIKDSAEFDETAAKEKVILKIQQKHTKAGKLKMRFRISVAASILFLIGIGYTIFLSSKINNKSLVYNTFRNEVLNIVLPDSSRVWLNENSCLEVAKAYNNRDRKILLQGEAYFEVARNEEKVFKIITGKITTKVLGTSFNLKSDNNNNIQLIVNSGKVKFYNRFSLKNKRIFTTGEKGEYFSSENKILHGINNDMNFLSWKTGVLSFSDTPFDEVCKTLSRHYKVPVEPILDDESLLLTGTFRNESLEDVLSTIVITFDIHITKSEKGFLLINDKNE